MRSLLSVWADRAAGTHDGKETKVDPITLLRDDHDNVRKLFKQFEGAGEAAHVENAGSSTRSWRS